MAVSLREIEIVGGGLAGLALGVYLRKLGVPVRILDAGSYPRHRVCGEFVCGVLPEILADLGVDGVYEKALRHREMRWWMGDDLLLQKKLPQVALGLSRHAVDAELARLFVEKGGDLRVDHKVDMEEDKGARVWAAGKKKSGRAEWIGLKIHTREAADFSEGLEMHSGRGGYVGVCGIESGRHNICGLFKVRKGVKGRGVALMTAYLREAGLRDFASKMERLVAAGKVDEESFCAVAGFDFGRQQEAAAGRFVIGDADLLIAPFSGNGMSMALESAWLAGSVLAEYARGEIEWAEAREKHRQTAGKNFAKRMKLATCLHPLLFSGAGRKCLEIGAKTGILPFGTMFSQLRKI